MKPFYNIFIGIAMLLIIIIFSSPVFARGGMSRLNCAPKLSHEFKIKALKESALVLQQSNPDLVKKLNDYAKEEISGIAENNKNRKAKIKVLRDSVAALKQSNPDLAKDLNKIEEEEYEDLGLFGQLFGI